MTRWLFIAALLAAPGFEGCDRRSEIPADVALAYSTLLKSLDPNAPGASSASLEGFARQNSRYAIASTADTKLHAWRTRLDDASREFLSLEFPQMKATRLW